MTRPSPWFLLTVAVIVLDHLTKWLASTHLVYEQPVVLLPVLDLTLLHNTGAAFSFLAGAGGWQRWLFMAISAAVSVWLVLWVQKLPRGKGWLAAALALILAGALGNLVDRVLFGYVVDFISVHWGTWYFPAFNVADSAITIGAGMMLFDALFLDREAHDGADPAR